MNYISTRGGIEPVAFQDAVLMGLADDGGLLVPESIPDVRGRLDEWRGLTYPQLAFEIIRLFVGDIPEPDLRAMIERTYAPAAFGAEVVPTVRVGPIHVLELWHGPTLAFKDIALQLLGNLFEYILAAKGGGPGPAALNILGATSGDTGSAAIYGVRGRRGIRIFMLHPHGRVSPIQERQMTTVLDANVHNLAVEGSFDDCQWIMKELAGDVAFKRRYALGAVNSVNWARVMAQIVYYFRTAFDVQRATGAAKVRVAVPTGNFGDVLAGWYAMQMGAPIARLLLATNENDILSVFFNSGRYARGPAQPTLAPSMDIQVASNFERYLYYRAGRDSAKLCGLMQDFAHAGELRIEPGNRDQGLGTRDQGLGASRRTQSSSSPSPESPVPSPSSSGPVIDPDFQAGRASTEEVLATIRKYHSQYGYLLDPHTAVGVAVAERLALAEAGEPVVCLATADPAKFPEAIRQATGQDLARHPAIDKLAGLPTRCVVVPCDKEAVRAHMIRVIEER